MEILENNIVKCNRLKALILTVLFNIIIVNKSIIYR